MTDTETDYIYKQMLNKSRDAARGGWESVRVMSTGERLAVALICNRADWLKQLDYTMAEAVDRVGQDWMSRVRNVERALVDEGLLPMESES